MTLKITIMSGHIKAINNTLTLLCYFGSTSLSLYQLRNI